MTYHFDDLRLPPRLLGRRDDQDWEARESGQEHRDKVLKALVDSMVDLLTARYTFGEGVDDNPEFHEQFMEPLWAELSGCLTRQDLLRWLVDWAQQAAKAQALSQIQRMQHQLNMLDDKVAWDWFTQNPS